MTRPEIIENAGDADIAQWLHRKLNAALAAAPLAGLAGHHAFAQVTPLKQRQTIKLAWGQTAVCRSPISVSPGHWPIG